MSSAPDAWFAPLLRPELASIQSYVPTRAPAGAVRLDANESPHALDPEARAALLAELATVDAHRYPDVRATRLRELVAEREGAHPDQIVFGCGTDEVIAMVINALAHPPPGRDRAAVLHPDPSFVMYRLSALGHGVRPVAIPLDDAWDLDVPGFVAAIEAHAPAVVFLPSPNNPTGNLLAADRLAAVVEAARRSLVLLDEAYGAYANRSYASLRREHPHVGQLQTLSKLGLAAIRVGWGILPAALAREVDKVRQPYNLNALSQRAAELCLTALAPALDRGVRRVVAERERLTAALAALDGVRVTPSAANFLWVEVPGDAGALHAALLQKGVVVRSFHGAGGRLARRLRITVGTAAENDTLLTALRASL